MRLVEAEFQIPDKRTSGGKSQDWAVDLAWGGADELAGSGMMDIFAKRGDRQVGTGTYNDEKLARLRRAGDEALQRQMRRCVADHELQSIHTRAPTAEFYWVVVAALVDDRTVIVNVMRRELSNGRIHGAVETGTQSECGPFWLAKLWEGALWITSSTAPAPSEPLATPAIEEHSGLLMTTALDVLRHLWFRGPHCFAPSHTMVWRHADSIAGTAKYPQEHVSTARLKIGISSATRPATATNRGHHTMT